MNLQIWFKYRDAKSVDLDLDLFIAELLPWLHAVKHDLTG